MNNNLRSLKNQYATVKRQYEKQKLVFKGIKLSRKDSLPPAIVASYDRAILAYERTLFRLKNQIDTLEDKS